MVIGAGIRTDQSELSIDITWYKWTNQRAGFSHSILMTSQELRAIGDEFSLCGEKNRPFTRAAGLLVTMSKYFILTCLLFPFVSFIILLALCQYYKRGCFSEEVECWGIVRVR